MAEPSGFLNVDKPLAKTSHDIVGLIRRAFKLSKVGHAGTLDPLASGVLIVCVGNATRLSDYVMASRKRYTARVRFGQVTDTYDAEGQVLSEKPTDQLTRDMVEAALVLFMGDLQQVPPMYSAIKQGGRKLYDLARAGEVVERQARAVRIERLDLLEWAPPECVLDVVCSAGTYIRSLAFDLGEALNVGAYLSGLRRTGSGAFTAESAVPLETLLNCADWQTYLQNPRDVLGEYPTITLTVEELDHFQHGRRVAVRDGVAGEPIFAYSPDGHLAAVVRAADGWLIPTKVFLA